MTELVVATRNLHKMREFTRLLEGMGIALRPLPDDAPEVDESADTFAANASLKAESAARHVNGWALSDDSGLEVAALDGEPGVGSARYSGITGPGADAANNQKLLTRLEGHPEAARHARFVAVLALAHPTRETLLFQGQADGFILTVPRGPLGFGYDPLFFYPPLGQSFAELTLEEKSRVSHRGHAVSAFRKWLGSDPRLLLGS